MSSRNQLHEIHAKSIAGEFFEVQGDGARLLDVLDHTPLQPGKFPPAVYDTPRLAEGVEFLARRGSRLTVPVMLAPHGSADDFTDMLENFQSVYDNTAYLGLEMYWQSPSDNRHPQPYEVTLFPQATGGFADFQKAQLNWTKEYGVQALPLELAHDDNSNLAVRMRALWELYLQTKNDETQEPAKRQVAARILERAYQATRQPAIIAQLGAWALTLEQEQKLLPYLPIMLGSWHGMSVLRLKNLDIDARAYTSPRYELKSERYKAYGEMIMQAMYNGYLPEEVLHVSPPQS